MSPDGNPSITGSSDVEELRSLVERARAGDVDAYAEIVRRFQDMAYGYAYSILGDFHLAQDAAQEAFVRAYRDLAKLREPAAFPGWFRRIVFKYCDRIRRRRPRAAMSLDATPGDVPSNAAGPVEAAQRRELRRSVLAAIRALPQHQRTVTTLFYIDGYTVGDIADFLETPAGTVKRRLHDSRKQLKERMMAMVADELKGHALPEGFSHMIAKLTRFPQREPEIRISPAEPGQGTVTYREGAFLEPLVEGGEALLAWYDWPEKELTGTACPRVIGKERVGGMECYRVRIPDFDPERRWTYDHEWYWAVDGGKLYFVAKSNFEPGAEDFRLMTWDDPDWDEERTGWPVELKLRSRIRWGSNMEATGPRFPRAIVPGGVWDVTIGGRTYTCLRALNLHYRGRRQGSAPEELGRAYHRLAEYMIALDGRSVLMRRYNGPAWNPESRGSVAALREKGCPGLRYNGVEFRLWYDCIPLRAIAPGTAEPQTDVDR